MTADNRTFHLKFPIYAKEEAFKLINHENQITNEIAQLSFHFHGIDGNEPSFAVEC